MLSFHSCWDGRVAGQCRVCGALKTTIESIELQLSALNLRYSLHFLILLYRLLYFILNLIIQRVCMIVVIIMARKLRVDSHIRL